MFNILFIVLLALVVWLSMAWAFTEDWGEYYALLIWAAVGMMLLIASEELLTLFLTLETMTICLYLSTAFEKTRGGRRRRAEVLRLRLGLLGAVPVRPEPGLRPDRHDPASTRSAGAVPRRGRRPTGLAGNVAGATAVLLMLVGFGFKVAAVPFHQWAPDTYEGAPAPVTAWIATGSKIASFVALMKVFLHALQPWSHPSQRARWARAGWRDRA